MLDAGPHGRILFGRLVGIAMVAFAAFGVVGCGGSASVGGLWDRTGSLFGSSPTLALAPVVGVPDKVSSELTQAMVAAGKDRNLTIVPGKTSDNDAYTLRGYLIAAPDSRGSKISYIWDVNDAKGTRVTRVTGEETVSRRGSDPWSGVNSTAIRSIAASSTSKLAAELPGGRRSSSSTPVAAAPSPSSSSARTAAVAGSAAATTAAATRSAPQTAPKSSGVVVAAVSGAPGDGSRSLATALKKKLYGKGVKLANGTATNVYTVQGVVKLSRAGAGKEVIRIDWQVLDPRGKRVGTVSQQNTIPKGSLNGPWGAIADAAAGAAADKIIKLIPKSS
jgi:hypothetical protein